MNLSQKETGANAMDCDEATGGNEDSGDDTASTSKPLTANQKCVIQNIHNNCGHPSREEFLRAPRLSRARSEVLNFVKREFECPACAAKGHPPKPRMPAALPRTFVSMRLLVWIFLKSNHLTVPKSLSATWYAGARCINCVFPFWTKRQQQCQSA